jgi:uncharacterized repeat protein (TIGR03806 family)
MRGNFDKPISERQKTGCRPASGLLFYPYPGIVASFIGCSFLLLISACQSGRASQAPAPDFEKIPYAKLSEYGFFRGKLRQLDPAQGVLPYDLITPLFTDYAHKARFVWMPPGAQAQADDQGYLLFPEHTVLIKNFYYPADFNKPEEKRDMVETRLLVRRNGVWEAFTYEWNAQGTDASLMQVGNIRPVAWTDESGEALQIDYVIPNKNQCKSCHNAGNKIEPIGPKLRNLNFALSYPDGATENQLLRWQQAGYLAPGDYGTAHPALPRWDDPAAPLAERAAAYLDVNCGHCHRPEGPANTTGTYLHWEEPELTRRGVGKSPVAAGKGSGGRHYGIVPGRPEESILVYRMESNDPGVMMPELGRMIPHREGIELIREWILGL